MDKFEINIYLCNLAKYNAGDIDGDWIDLPSSNLHEQVQDILGDDEEWIILDTECDFLDIYEYEDIYKLNDLALKLQELDQYDKTALKSILNIEEDIDEALKILENERYILYDNVTDDEDMGTYLLENDYYNVPKELEDYIDTESLGRDYAINNCITYTNINTAIQIF